MTLGSVVGNALRQNLAAPLYHAAREQVAMARYARRANSPALSLGRRAWLWRRGFVPSADGLYDFETHSVDAYLSTRQHVRTREINGHWRHLVENKLAGHWLLSPFEAERQPVHGVVIDGRAFPADRVATEDGVEMTTPRVANATPATEFVADRIDEEGEIVLKPVFGGRGEGIDFASREDDSYRLNDELVTDREFRRRMSDLDGYLVAGFVEQAKYADALYPDATNTVRVLTVHEDGEAFVAASIHRIGTAESAPADNCSQGGLTAAIDLETGRLSEATTIDPTERPWFASHPESDARIEGTTVPGWDRIRKRVTAIAADLPYLPYLGWDLVVTGEETFRVLELNNLVGVESLQVHGPLLADARVRRFYERHGVC
ncbi:sugar-transfer associated ATP-grasp domain-containing protein [Halapricum salinum]|uniref:Alpha-L-glutamate ligase-related protein ATP-grasp domain-containing protein n=1 Tax=Halapricum salinum TaxID=1457250 RepID=A0A4D6HBC5_9EURY|nr:sugar-transfer associated ATP-grasp domain-containing protein [Halapricum salinum]QCC50352.1 hypothetical protein DV733_03465 [Halapricum salinum]